MKKILQYFIIVFLILVSSFLFRNEKIQSVNWTYPYTSGAANLSYPFLWKIGIDEYKVVSKLSNKDFSAFNHKASNNTIIYNYNNFGYVFIIYIARNLFPNIGELNAVVVFQILIHCLLSISIFRLLSFRKGVLFTLLYSINPIVIHFVTFPCYYFWTIIPCYFFISFYLKKKELNFWLIPIGLVLYLSFLIRPTTIFVIIGYYVFVFIKSARNTKILTALSFSILLCLILCFDGKKKFSRPQESAIWHTAFIGIGAYQNNYNVSMNDESGYNKYLENTGKVISTNPITGTYTDFNEKNAYFGFLKDQYLKIVKNDIFLIIKNASLNFVLAYSFGYYIGNSIVNGINLFIGLIFLFILIYRKLYMPGICIFLYSIAYVVYFPPIAAYHFGSYLPFFLIWAIVFDELYVKYFENKFKFFRKYRLK
jgi:hypothetical protein